jgi:glyoxylase-like metal-dependent hydrolase (beta-lactamase superfamily II)
MNVHALYDARTYTLTYVVWDTTTRDAVVIDAVLDFDPASGRIWEESVDAVTAFLQAEGLTLRWILETHAHADHLSGSQALKRRHGAGVAIGARIQEVQSIFKGVFDLDPSFPTDGSQFDRLLHDGETLAAGSITVRAISTPGHTPACLSYHIGDAVFTGDALFMPDYGVGRCDFPAGSAETLYRSVHDGLYALPDSTRVFVGHDYLPEGRTDFRWETTVAAEMAGNIHLGGGRSEDEFAALREARDATLKVPALILPSLQINIRAGALPPPELSGKRFLKLPLNAI